MMTVDAVPLTTLLSWALIAFTMELDNAFERLLGSLPHRPLFRVSLVMWANYLRAVPEEGIALDTLAATVRLPVAAARSMTGGLERWGYVTVDERRPGGTGFGSGRGVRGASVIAPTAAGRATQRAWEPLPGEIETRWTERFGTERVDALCRELVADEPGRALPRFLPIIVPTNGFVTELRDDAGEDADAADDLPTLLSRALLTRTVAFESVGAMSLPVHTDFLRLLAEGGVRQRDLPIRTGLAKEGVAMAVTRMKRDELATIEPSSRTITLTAKGRAAFEVGAKRLEVSDDDAALRDALQRVLSQREQLLAGLEPPKAGWRTQKPYVTQTNAILHDPIAALPHHPLVLHRGGWPDGA